MTTSYDVAVVVPVKPASVAKSRLRAAFGQEAAGLARAMAVDVLQAARSSPAVGDVLVVSAAPNALAQFRGAEVPLVLEPAGAGLNGALETGARHVRMSRPDAAVIFMPADCPAVKPEDFDRLAAALALRRAPLFVPDANGLGTCALCLPPGRLLRPNYGPDSAALHSRAGIAPLLGREWQRVARDVDVPSDLEAAARLGVGTETQAWLVQHGLLEGQGRSARPDPA